MSIKGSANKYVYNDRSMVCLWTVKPMILLIFCVTIQNQTHIWILTLIINYLILDTSILLLYYREIPPSNANLLSYACGSVERITVLTSYLFFPPERLSTTTITNEIGKGRENDAWVVICGMHLGRRYSALRKWDAHDQNVDHNISRKHSEMLLRCICKISEARNPELTFLQQVDYF